MGSIYSTRKKTETVISSDEGMQLKLTRFSN